MPRVKKSEGRPPPLRIGDNATKQTRAFLRAVMAAQLMIHYEKLLGHKVSEEDATYYALSLACSLRAVTDAAEVKAVLR